MPVVIAGLIRVDPPCADDPELFYSEALSQVEQAKAICARCPWLKPCRRAALVGDEKAGTWGGLTAPQRQQLAGQHDTQPDNRARGAA